MSMFWKIYKAINCCYEINIKYFKKFCDKIVPLSIEILKSCLTYIKRLIGVKKHFLCAAVYTSIKQLLVFKAHYDAKRIIIKLL